MKMAALFTDGDLQLVLTPETDQERALCKLCDPVKGALIGARGGFYECQGDSLIVRIKNP